MSLLDAVQFRGLVSHNEPVKPRRMPGGRLPPPPAGLIADPPGFRGVRVTSERVEAAFQVRVQENGYRRRFGYHFA